MSELSPEMAAQYGPQGPTAYAHRWLRAVLVNRDWLSAWELMAYPLRIDWAQRWLWGGQAHPALAGLDLEQEAVSLAQTGADWVFWPSFAKAMVDYAASVYPLPPDGLDGLGASSVPRIIDFDLELVLFIRLDLAGAVEGSSPIQGGGVVIPGRDGGYLVEAFAAIAMQSTDQGWLVASLAGEVLPDTSWPPRA